MSESIPPNGVSRRGFLGWVAVVVPATRGWRLPLFLRRHAELDVAAVRALASAILPAELGSDGARRAADAFLTWTRGYRAGAERSHGYGSARIRTTGDDPSVRWALGLGMLDQDARKAHGQTFAAITDEQRRAIVRSQLSSERGASIADIAGAQHVAVALLAHFYDSPDATDLCYEARIGVNGCRPLAASPQRPVPLQRAGARDLRREEPR